MKNHYLKKSVAISIICLLMLVAMPVVNSEKETSKSDISFNWIKGNIFFNCHVVVTADESKGVAEVGNAPPILVWSTECGTVEITTQLRHKTLTGRTKGIVVYSSGPYGNDPFYIDRNAAVCIVTTY